MGFFNSVIEKLEHEQEQYENYCDKFRRYDLDRLMKIWERRENSYMSSAEKRALATVIREKRGE